MVYYKFSELNQIKEDKVINNRNKYLYSVRAKRNKNSVLQKR